MTTRKKYSKDKKIMEEKLGDVMATLAEEEEKSKHLVKLKTKHESTIGELEEKLRKDGTQKQELERSKRKIERDINDVRDQLSERKKKN